MKLSRASDKGFTVVEMIIVIIVLAVLVTLMAVSYGPLQAGARDSERQTEISQLKIALEKYYSNNSQYPDVCLGGDDVECVATDLETELAPYLDTIPEDPRTPDRDYLYIRGGTSGNAYGLQIQYESRATCKTGEKLDAGWWASVASC